MNCSRGCSMTMTDRSFELGFEDWPHMQVADEGKALRITGNYRELPGWKFNLAFLGVSVVYLFAIIELWTPGVNAVESLVGPLGEPRRYREDRGVYHYLFFNVVIILWGLIIFA